LPIAVASGGYRDTITHTLDQLGIRDWFDAMVVAEDTPRHKPEPDVFLEAARRLGVKATGCVVFEDTEIGLEAARRAGMTGIDVRNWIKRPE
jgi:HAD superfamily hydrolase (TIGR01509 family)